MTGELRFYDAATRWGVIAGDDGRLYMLRREHSIDAQLREGERVTFEPLSGPGGLRAGWVRRVRSSPAGTTGPKRSV